MPAHARRILSGLEFDLIVLDVMMPGEDGISLCRDLRGSIGTPILLLTAKAETSDRITGLEAGADDYLPKPFEPKELLLRINAILRRAPAAEPVLVAPKVLTLGPIRYDIDRGEMWHGDDQIRLTATESQLMRIFSAKPGEAVSRASLVERAGPRLADRRRNAPSTCRSPACAARSRPIPSSRATCRPCGAQATCWPLTESRNPLSEPVLERKWSPR